MDGRYVVSSMIFTSVSESIDPAIDMLLLRHVLRISGIYGCLASDSAWQWSRTCEVVSSPSLYSGHVSALLLLVVGEVAMGYCCTSRRALMVAFRMASGVLIPCHTGCNWLVEHASMLRRLSMAFTSACSCRCSVSMHYALLGSPVSSMHVLQEGLQEYCLLRVGQIA